MKKPKVVPNNVSKLLPKSGKPASSPGTVRYIGKKRDVPVRIEFIHYDEKKVLEKEISSIQMSVAAVSKTTVTWLNITGVHDEKIIEDIGANFSIHPLVQEDIANTTHGPKIEEYDNNIFIVLKMAYFNEGSAEVVLEQVSLLVGEGWVISLQERDGDILEGLRERIRQSKGKVRKMGSDYLMYAIIDAVIDHYFIVLEQLGEQVESMEKDLMKAASQELLVKIYRLKRELVFLRKSIWPMREVIGTLFRNENHLVKETTRIFIRDVYDHTVQVAETVETFRDMASGMLDLYLTINSNKMNQIMKVLTIFAAIFIPLTFLAGVYGMNFEFMPELHYRWGYPIWWAFAIITGVGLLVYFKTKKWL